MTSGDNMRGQKARATPGRATPTGRRTNSRACINCHKRKIRCDISDQEPCTNCISNGEAECRLFQRKRERVSAVRSRQRRQTLKPRETSRDAETRSAEEAEVDSHDRGNLADLFDREEVRSSTIDHRARSCFIGTEISNFNYLVRQNSLTPAANASFHVGNRQFHPRYTTHDIGRVPPEALELPDKNLADRLIQAYFEHVNRGWPIVDEEDFMIRYRGQDSQIPLSLVLLNAVFQVGAFVLAAEDENMKSLQATFFRRTKTLVDYRHEQDRTISVQVALLMTWYSDGLEEVVANAWYWIGVAARTAIGLGMHRDATQSKMLPMYKRTWIRLWWVLFQFDTISSASYGKPQALNLQDSDVPNLEPSHFEGIPSAEAEFVIHHTRLCVIISQAMRDRWALRSSASSKIAASKRADELLAEFTMQLPSSLQATTQVLDVWQATLNLTYNNVIILLHRAPPKPALRDEVSDVCSDAKVCGEASFMITSIFETLLSKALLHKLWIYASHALFTALIDVATESASSNPIMVAKYHKRFDTLIAALRQLAKHWRFAQGLLQLFEQRSRKIKEQSRSEGNREHAAGTEQHTTTGFSLGLRRGVHGNAISPNDDPFINRLVSTANEPGLRTNEPTAQAGLQSNNVQNLEPLSGDFAYVNPSIDPTFSSLVFEDLPFLDTTSFDFFLEGMNT
ncbi:Acetamidase regulatory protein-like protein [Paramyrothecium foliicola]|nr:Acetamidase regulatory protein-like protein [Paramyrothecium foliicola]